MAETAQIGKKQSPGLSCAKEADPEACRFLEDFDAKGIDLNHLFLQKMFKNAPGVAEFCQRINDVMGSAIHEVVLDAYLEAFLKQHPLSWTTIDRHLETARSLFPHTTPGSSAYLNAKFLDVQARQFLEQHRSSCSNHYDNCDQRYAIYTKLKYVPEHRNKFQKVVPRLRDAGFDYVVDATLREARENLGLGPDGEAGIDEAFFDKKIEVKPLTGALPGFELHQIALEKEGNIGFLVVADPKKGARVKLIIDENNGISRSDLEQSYSGRMQYQGSVAMDDYRILLGTTITEGDFKRAGRAGYLDGLVIVDQMGSLQIADKRDLGLENPAHLRQLIEKAANFKLSAVSAASFDPSGKREKWRDRNSDQKVRLLFVFKDGRFGLLDAPGRSTNQTLAVLYRLQKKYGDLTRVVLCDRGYYDSAAYYEDGVRRVSLGDQDRPTRNAIVFLSDTTPAHEKEAPSARADAKTNP